MSKPEVSIVAFLEKAFQGTRAQKGRARTIAHSHQTLS